MADIKRLAPTNPNQISPDGNVLHIAVQTSPVILKYIIGLPGLDVMAPGYPGAKRGSVLASMYTHSKSAVIAPILLSHPGWTPSVVKKLLAEVNRALVKYNPGPAETKRLILLKKDLEAY